MLDKVNRRIICAGAGLILLLGLAGYFFHSLPFLKSRHKKISSGDTLREAKPYLWIPPDTASIPITSEGELIRYGRELVMHTGAYFGPGGRISGLANGMNCQNCHIDGGTRTFGNNFSQVASTYPKYRPRNDRVETIAFRVNSCMERSLNGKALDSSSREMKAFIAYLEWIGKEVPRKTKLFGIGTQKLSYLNRAADPEKGKRVFADKCQTCHGENGEGKREDGLPEYQYPPLWGLHSYNTGAGLYRISLFAGYVKNNMPYGVTWQRPQLTDEEAWDVAAFVNSQTRPAFEHLNEDWPHISRKPPDYPFGPYADSFSETRHKYGPYNGMLK